MEEKYDYTIHLDSKFGFLELIDIPSLAAAVKDQWYNQTLCQVNESVVRLGVMKALLFPKGWFIVPERAVILMVEKSTVQPTGD